LSFQKKKINLSTIEDIKKIKNGILIGPGASGKTRLLHEIYDIEIEYKAPEIIKNKVYNEQGKSLKYGKNVFGFTKKHPIIYIAPNYKSKDGYKPNIDEWLRVLKKKNAIGIICYIKPHTHKSRLKNRVINKRNNNARQHLDNYPFSYQNLFYKLDQNDVNYYIISSEQ